MATSNPSDALELFSAAPFHWELRGQAVLLSSAAPPAPLQYTHLERLFDKEPLNRLSTRLPNQFTGLLLPGVDGDFVELVAFDEIVEQTLATALASECSQANIPCRLVPESDFTL